MEWIIPMHIFFISWAIRLRIVSRRVACLMAAAGSSAISYVFHGLEIFPVSHPDVSIAVSLLLNFFFVLVFAVVLRWVEDRENLWGL